MIGNLCSNLLKIQHMLKNPFIEYLLFINKKEKFIIKLIIQTKLQKIIKKV